MAPTSITIGLELDETTDSPVGSTRLADGDLPRVHGWLGSPGRSTRSPHPTERDRSRVCHANLSVGDGQTRTFSFTAVQHLDGTVTGQGEVNNPSFPIRVHFTIDCLKLGGGNRVVVSGPVTQSSDPGTVGIGRISVFAVEGANAEPDRTTTIPDYAPPRSCTDFSVSDSGLQDDTSGVVVRPWRVIEAGEIQVGP